MVSRRIARYSIGEASKLQLLAELDQIAVLIKEGKLSHGPWLVFNWFHSRDPVSWQSGRTEFKVQGVDICHPHVATGIALVGPEVRVRKEVQFKLASVQDRVCVCGQQLATEAKPLVEGQRAPQRAARQDWNRLVDDGHGRSDGGVRIV